MIDTGPIQSGKKIEKWFDEIPVSPQEIRLIILTHGHCDHVGSALRIKKLTGAQIAVHRDDSLMVENAQLVLPSAASTWGHIVRCLFRTLLPILRFNAFKADMIIGDEELSLEDYGIPGKIIHTPGHTPGSVSVLLETGDAFVGCMTHNNFPFRLRPNLPIFAEDLSRLRESWKLLLDAGAKTIYPAHGNPFSSEEMLKVLS
jgi:glyoxylase-like metal-dependent hydrolase (beta-lactamase superfamily II)